MTPELTTARVRLRAWRDEDRAPFAALNADPEVMRHFPSTLTRDQSDAFVDRITAGWADRGWGLWAAEIIDTGAFVGFVGFNGADFDAPFTPAVEIGWRLSAGCWNRGLATEAARAVVGYGWETLGWDEIVSFTAVENAASRRVMEKLGMRHDARDDFDHPGIEVGHRLRRHVLYRLTRAS